MFLADNWTDYEILDAGDGEKRERWGNITLLRPDPQAVWPMRTAADADAHYIRSQSGGGYWEYTKKLPESWQVNYGDMRFLVRPTGFKHTGLFPEQAVNWDWMRQLLSARPGAAVLNLFAYTGAATAACAMEGARVTHVDAAKSMNTWAKENLALCGQQDAPVRFLADDAIKFAAREARRGNRYDAIIMDPPSYGRGPGGEMWKIERGIYPLVEAAVSLLTDKPLFFLINGYTAGLSPTVLKNVLKAALHSRKAKITCGELGLPIRAGGLILPCGVCARVVF